MKDEIFNDCLESKQNANGKPFWRELANKWGYTNSETLRCAFKRECKKRDTKFDANPTEKTEYTESDDYINIVCSSRRIKTKEDVIEEFNINTDVWEVEKFIIRTDEAWRKDRKVDWHVKDGKTIKGDVEDSGKILLVPLTRVEVRFKKKSITSIGVDDIAKLYENVSIVPQKVFSKTPTIKDSDQLLEVCVADLHRGSRQFDTTLDYLEELFPEMIQDVCNRVSVHNFSELVFAPLGDVFHYDSAHFKTSRHETIMETNGMTPVEVFDSTVSMFTGGLNKLLEIAPIRVKYVPGNHDGLTLYHLLKVLEAYYKDNKYVSFNLEQRSRKFERFGTNLIAWEHGDISKQNRFSWLQQEAREEWGKTNKAEIHFGHLHHESVEEQGGITRRRIPAMAQTDSWHYEKGFIGAIRAGVSFVWHRELGLRDIWYSNV